jgi:phosphoribosyl-dephospho-CoA transferase
MRRHDLATIRPGASFRIECNDVAQDAEASVRDWIAGGLPLVVARQSRGQSGGTDQIAMGLTLPPNEGSLRIGCLLHSDDILQVCPPTPLLACIPSLPLKLVMPLLALAQDLQSIGIEALVYGSLAWQTISGLEYLHAESDIDLLCEVGTPAQLPELIAMLKKTSSTLVRRLDGEIRFPDGSAVAWLELANALHDPAAELLIKGDAAVRMVRVGDLDDFLQGETDAC